MRKFHIAALALLATGAAASTSADAAPLSPGLRAAGASSALLGDGYTLVQSGGGGFTPRPSGGGGGFTPRRNGGFTPKAHNRGSDVGKAAAILGIITAGAIIHHEISKRREEERWRDRGFRRDRRDRDDREEARRERRERETWRDRKERERWRDRELTRSEAARRERERVHERARVRDRELSREAARRERTRARDREAARAESARRAREAAKRDDLDRERELARQDELDRAREQARQDELNKIRAQAREQARQEFVTSTEQAKQEELAKAREQARQEELAKAREQARQEELAKAREQARQEELAKAREQARQEELAKAREQAREEELAKARQLARQEEIAKAREQMRREDEQRKAREKQAAISREEPKSSEPNPPQAFYARQPDGTNALKDDLEGTPISVVVEPREGYPEIEDIPMLVIGKQQLLPTGYVDLPAESRVCTGTTGRGCWVRVVNVRTANGDTKQACVQFCRERPQLPVRETFVSPRPRDPARPAAATPAVPTVAAKPVVEPSARH